MKQLWWKALCALLLLYTIIGGFLLPVPLLDRGNLEHTIRNLYFHVPMWFGMMALFTASFWYAIRHLRSFSAGYDIRSAEFAKVGILFGMLGIITGAEWANYTWGEPWSNDPKQLGAAICLLTYFAYFILRGGIKDEEKRGRISAVYNIFAFAMMVPLLFIMPRMVDSLHPGNGGNPAFSNYDLDNNMRLVFYPAVLGWSLLGFWLATLKIRLRDTVLSFEENRALKEQGAIFFQLMIFKIFPLSLAGIFLTLLAGAQTYDSKLDQTVVANGKLGVVVMVLATIFAGILLFLVYLERRIRRFEKEHPKQ